MAAMALEDVVKQLQVNKRSTDDVRKVLTDFILMTKRNMLDQLESDREQKKQTKEATKAVSKPAKGGKKGGKGGGGFSFIGLPAIGGIVTALTAAIGTISAGLIAITAGIVAVELGFRPLFGFEKGALTKIKSMVKFPTWISNAVIRLRTAALAIFGLTPNGMPIRGADGKMTKAIPIATQIANKLKAMKTAFLLNFGIGVDGKNVAKGGGPRGMAKQPLWARAGRAMIRMLQPLTSFITGITGWFAGKGLKIVTFFKDFIGKGGGKIFRLFAKFFWPLTILMSLFDGFTAYKEKEGTGYEKFAAGIGGFVGSLIGSIFDLAKGAINWLLKKILPGAVDKDGNWDKNTILGGWMSTFESFSFADTIQNMIEGLFALPKKAIEWIKLLFTDPVEALTQYLKGALGIFLSVVDILWFPIRLAIDWVLKKFGWEETDAPMFSFKTFILEAFDKVIIFFKESVPKIVDGIVEAVSTAKANMIQWAKDLGPRLASAITGSFGVVTEWLGGLGARIGNAIKRWWIVTKGKMTKGLLSLAEFFEELPQRLKIMIKRATRLTAAGVAKDDEKLRLLDMTNTKYQALEDAVDRITQNKLDAHDKMANATVVTDASITNDSTIVIQKAESVVVKDGLD